jgi:hypothetical protein
MSSIFKDVLKGVDNVEKDFLGEDYDYTKFIKSPSQLGVTGNGSLDALGKDIGSMTEYIDTLVFGGGASTTGKPLGSKFFMKTGGQCKDVKTGKLVPRSVYINNVPENMAVGKFDIGNTFRGLIPGIVDNMLDINPVAMMGAFMEGSEPKCQEMKLEVIDSNNRSSMKSGYLTLTDINELNTRKELREGMRMLVENEESDCREKIRKKIIATGISLVSIYLLWRLMRRR